LAGFNNGVSATNEYTYDNNGNLTKDSNKGITNIAYNSLNLPSKVTFSDGSTIVYSYAADGTKLRTVHTISGTTTQKDYCANVVYENGVQKMLLTEEGYVDLSAPTPTYYYYLKDHQGNNRVVINSSGTVAETNHYYPFGSLFASTSVQPYKYNGKELDAKKGLNWYDYGARHYDATLGRWFVVDPLAEKYYAWSPYNYCLNNPISNIDPDGKQIMIPPTFLGLNTTPILGTSNPLVPLGRSVRMMQTTDKMVKTIPKEEHHLIPKSLGKHTVVEKAKKAGLKFDGKENKISVDKYSKATGEGQHGKHPQYTRQIRDKLDQVWRGNSQMTPEQALKVLRDIISNAKSNIENSPNVKINDLQLKMHVIPIDNLRINKIVIVSQ
jgi:RHS repeat-associated protein